ncbi:cold-shock protein [Flavisolibacter ginsenosidimutans]|uniref:Cold shock domain-containing protein n=1 Tax=Flavisolibacter ginsenosidimutans TaxID=661481 RepID=A0A5B8UFY7_9BACT|nr:cold shock domain-containing protein [Flavisolibacter ginsenosidimutans]QEC55265.1 cold shock domain-containing protein [Flavisolibacter ginsenosidimutans]
MARSQQSFSKREKEKQRAKEKQEKKEKMAERKATKKEQSLEDMMAYIDENGNLSSTPPDPSKMKSFNADEIEIGVPQQKPLSPEELIRQGSVSFFNSAKGFGFIKDSQTGESVFFHQKNLSFLVKEGDRLIFETEMGDRGPVAINVKKQP